MHNSCSMIKDKANLDEVIHVLAAYCIIAKAINCSNDFAARPNSDNTVVIDTCYPCSKSWVD